MAMVYEKSKMLTDAPLHYCPGCTHGIIHKLVAESLEELDAVLQGMYDLSKTYTMARWFDPLPVEVGCKTGTAETSAKAASTNAVFVCFAPYDDPQIALCLVAEGGDAGGSLAELAAGILAQYFSTGSSLSTVSGENTLLR